MEHQDDSLPYLSENTNDPNAEKNTEAEEIAKAKEITEAEEIAEAIEFIGGPTSDQVDQIVPMCKSPFLLRKGLKLWKKLSIKGDIEVQGEENLKKIPENSNCIFASSHISGHDVPTVGNVLCEDFNLAIANQSTHHHFMQEPGMNLSIRLSGKKNYFPIDFEFDKSEEKVEVNGKRGFFNPKNYVPMKDIMENRGKSMLMAAHSPSLGSLPEKGGLGAIYLAQISENAVVIPIASIVDFPYVQTTDAPNAKNLAKKPTAKVIIGEPLHLEKIIGIETYANLLEKEKENTLNPEEKSDLIRMKTELRNQSETLMQNIAKLMPRDKRGQWN